MNDPVVKTFCRETLRPLSDLMGGLGGLLSTCRSIKAAAIGKQLHTQIGTTQAELWRSSEWSDADYNAIPGVDDLIDDTWDAGQIPYTVRTLIQSLRAIAALNAMLEENPGIEVLFAAYATNPRFALSGRLGV